MNFLSSLISKFRTALRGNPSLPPNDFFDKIKDSRQVVTTEMIEELKACLGKEAQQFIDNGQLLSAKRLMFHIECADREQKVIAAGINQFVYRDDLDEFITNVSQQVVKIIELEHFERKIPNDKSKEIQRVKDLFDQVYIVFTDYTGREERKVEKKRRASDPIAFGAFKSKDNKIWNHRFYFICDWEDEYCDLTLDKYVSQMVKAGYEVPVHVADEITVEELKVRYEQAKEEAKKKTGSDITQDSNLYYLIDSVETVTTSEQEN